MLESGPHAPCELLLLEILVPVLANKYGADEEAVWDAIRCELALEAA